MVVNGQTAFIGHSKISTLLTIKPKKLTLTKQFLLSLTFVGFFIIQNTFGQQLKPGFDKNEYKELMLISARTTAVPDYYKDFPEPSNFKMIYQ